MRFFGSMIHIFWRGDSHPRTLGISEKSKFLYVNDIAIALAIHGFKCANI